MDKITREKILSEISKIDIIFEKSTLLLQKCKLKEPDFIELNAVASVLHSYYGGLENVFKLIYKSFDEKPLTSSIWHSELLQSMFETTEKHQQILSSELLPSLKKYLGFRHVFRHAYDFELDWERLKPLFFGMTENWQTVKKDILTFVNTNFGAQT